jgi:uncharacterized membrane protein YkoI
MPFLGTGPILGSGSPTTEGSSMKNRVRKLVMGVAALATVALGGATVASAVSNGNGDARRSDETALTGDTATKVKEAALAKTGGGTVERVETDADGHAAYEAHVLKSDGTHVTVYVNKQFEVVGTESGHAGGPGHARGDETALTGDTATKVKDAALAKTGGGTVERVETDADGHAAYEAHVLKSDGTHVTVYVNKQFEVVGTDTRS